MRVRAVTAVAGALLIASCHGSGDEASASRGEPCAEPARGMDGWCRTDRIVAGARSRGLSVLGLVTYSPSWASGTKRLHGEPRSPDDFARFAAAAVARYAPVGLHTWEVWNEPNIAGFCRAAHVPPCVLRACGPVELRRRRSPSIQLSGHWTGTQDWNPFSHLDELHDVMVAHCDGDKPVWLTEYGAPTGLGPGAVSDALQADLVSDAYDAAAALPWVRPMFWYTIRNGGTDQFDISQNFGLVRRNYSAKPALEAFNLEMAAPDS